jgi:hypothetical protein
MSMKLTYVLFGVVILQIQPNCYTTRADGLQERAATLHIIQHNDVHRNTNATLAISVVYAECVIMSVIKPKNDCVP